VSNLEPDLGESTSAALQPTLPPPTITVTPRNPLAPRLPDELQAKIDGFNAGTIKPPTTPIDTTGLDTSAIITNLPDARKSFVTKYTRLKGMVKALPEPVRKSIVQMDLDRAEKGQGPMNDQETLAAIITTMRNKPATEEPKDTSILGQLKAIPANAVDDAGNILKSLPKLPGALVETAKVVGNTFAHSKLVGDGDYSKSIIDQKYKEARARGENPIQAFVNLPVANLVPGSFLASNLSQGTEGLSNMAEHPVGTVLDVLPFASKAAEASKIGKLAVEEKAAGISSIKPLRATLTRKILPGEEVVGSQLAGTAVVKPAQTTLSGSRLAPAKLGSLYAPVGESQLGSWITQAFSQQNRDAATIFNVADAKFVDALQGIRPVTMADEKIARRAYSLAADQAGQKLGVSPERMVAVYRALATDRKMIFETPGWSDAEKALASKAIKLSEEYKSLNLAEGNGMMIGDEFYDLKTGKSILKAQEALAKRAVKVDEGLFARVAKARNDLVDLQKAGPLSTVDRHVLERLDPVYEKMNDYFTNPDTTVTLQEINKASRSLTTQKTRLGGPGQVGAKAAPVGDVRLDSLGKIRDEIKAAASKEKDLIKSLDRAPARWIDSIQALAKDKANDYLVGKGIDPLEAARMIAERDFQIAPDIYSQKIMEKLIRDTEPMWKELKAAGIDPLYLHRVPLNKQRILSLPRLSDFATPLSQAEKRNIFNATPYSEDVTIALAHQGAELVSNRMSREAMDSLGRMGGIREGALRERVMPLARERQAGTTNQVNDVAMQIIGREYVPFEPGAFGRKLPKVLNNDDRIWIHKSLAKEMERYYHPVASELLGGVRAVNGVFRTSVLPFSVRWQINNNFGHAIVMGITNPGAFFHLRRARQVMKAWNAGEDVLPAEIGYGFGSARKEVAASKYATAAYMNSEKAYGSKLRQVWDRIQESKPKQAGSAAAQKMYDINSFSDETVKVATYLNIEGKALRRGATDAAAMEAGLHAVNNWFQNWNSLTTLERQVLREAYPFYAFTSYAMRFVMNYPGTHPLRTAIMSNMAEAEIADMNQAMPDEMLDFLALGPQDENGDQRFLSLRGLNPFSDTANSFTIEGFLSGSNPLIQAVIKSRGGDLGYGVGAGQPTYDAETGKQVKAKPGFVESLVSSTIPQIGFLNRIAGRDAEYNALRRTNPEAAQRLLVSGIGIPTMGRTINIPQTQIKGELERLRTQADVFKRARETGDYTEAMKWPALRPQIEQLQRLNALGLLREYNPNAGVANSVTDAVGSVKPWPT